MNIKEEIEDIQSKVKEQSWAYEILQDYKKANAKMFWIIITLLLLWFTTIGIFMYYLTHYVVEEEIRTQEIEEVEGLTDTDIINGDYYGNN